jgi:methyl-accepting chemotaxis protein
MKERSWTIGQQIAAGFGVSLFMLILLGISSFRSTSAMLRTSYAVESTHESLYDMEELLSTMKDAESGQRGFIITGDESFLEPYKTASEGVQKKYDELVASLQHSPRQRERLEKLKPLMDAKLAELRDTIERRRREGLEPAAKLVSDGRGKRAMEGLREIIAQMIADENELLKKRAAEVESTSASLTTNLGVGMGLTIAFVVAAGIYIIRKLDRRIGTAVQHVQSSSAELQAAAAQQVTGAKEQVTAANEVSTTIKELLSTSRQIAESAQKVTHVAIDTTSAAKAGDQTVQRAQQAIDVVRRQVDLIVTHMLELGRKSQEIGGILDIINELSEQTNILAINATIESAGAGEAGRRFAVVADEIRKLADRVGGSTKEIRQLIEEIRAASNTTVMATEDGSKAVDAGTRQFGEVAVSFKQIVELVANTAQASREIELSTKQQTTAVEQVNAAIAEVARTARETEASLNQTLLTASELTTLSRDLAKLIQRAQRAS